MKTKRLGWLALLCVTAIATAAGLTAYMNDKQQYYNRDASQNAVDTISTLSCILNQTGAAAEDELSTPQNAYAVWVDEDRCRPGSIPSGDGADAAVTMAKYWVVQERDGDTLRVKWWEYGDEINGGRISYASAEILKGAEENSTPYGVWSVNWCVTYLESEMAGKTGDDACSQRGRVDVTADNEYRLFYKRLASGSIPAYSKQTSGAISADLTSGYGRFTETLASGLVNDGAFGFKGAALKQTLNGATQCKNPIAESADSLQQIWDGWLYDPVTEARITNAAGPFAVKRVSDGQVAWASHEGVRMAGKSDAESGGTFVRVEGEDQTQYTAFRNAGLLLKRTPVRLENGLKDIDGLRLRFRLKKDVFGVSDSYGAAVTTNGDTNYPEQYVLAHWDEATQKLIFTDADTSDTGMVGRLFAPLAAPVTYSFDEFAAKAQSGARKWERSMWGYLIGSDIDYFIQYADNAESPAAVIASPLVYRMKSETVIPGSSQAPTDELVCIGKCPRPFSDGGEKTLRLDKNISGDGGIYDWDKAALEAKDTYTYDSAGLLKVNGISVEDAVIDRNGLDGYRDDLYLDGFVLRSDLSKLSCHNGTKYCSYDVRLPADATADEGAGINMGLPASYVWRTGPQRWVRFAGLKRSDGSVVRIDPPMNLFFDVPDQQIYGASRGKRVALRYPGNGKLWMPGRCENIAGGQPTSDCSGRTDVYVNDFIIPFDPEVGRVQDESGNTYLVKWTRKGVYYPNHSDPNVCETPEVIASFDSGSALTLPTEGLWVNPRGLIGIDFPADADPSKPRYVNGVKTY